MYSVKHTNIHTVRVWEREDTRKRIEICEKKIPIKGLTNLLNNIVLSTHKTEVQKGQRKTHMLHILEKVF